MLTNTSRWSHARGNEVIQSPWQATAPTKLDIADLDAHLIAEFLHYLEAERGNSIRTRNGRLTAIHSTFTFAALRHPEHAEMITRVLASPPKRYDRTQVTYLNRAEVAALLGAPDRPPGPDDATMPGSCSRSRPGYGSQSSRR